MQQVRIQQREKNRRLLPESLLNPNTSWPAGAPESPVPGRPPTPRRLSGGNLIHSLLALSLCCALKHEITRFIGKKMTCPYNCTQGPLRQCPGAVPSLPTTRQRFPLKPKFSSACKRRMLWLAARRFQTCCTAAQAPRTEHLDAEPGVICIWYPQPTGQEDEPRCWEGIKPFRRERKASPTTSLWG